MRLLILLFCVLFSSPFLLLGQQFSFIKYNTNDGLPQSQVTAICQDNDGYLWVGTAGGLAKFNGNNFVRIGKKNGLLNNRITSLDIINDIIYVGHTHGISIKTDTNSFVSVPFQENDLTPVVTGFFFKDSILYVSTNGEGLFYLPTGGKFLIKVKDSPDRIRDVEIYNNQIFLATRTGVYNFHGEEEFENLTESFEKSFSGLFTRNDKLYATTFNGILYQYNDGEFVSILENEDYFFRDLIIDSDGNKWINSMDGVLIKKDNEVTILTEKQGLPTNDINVIFEDSEQNIWMGTNAKGLIRFTNDVFTHYNEKAGLPSNLIMAIEIDDYKNTWISTLDQGTFKINKNGDFEHLDFIQNTVWQILSTPEQVFFASNYGLYSYDYSTYQSYFAENYNLPSNRINGLHLINDSLMLVSTSGGSVFYDLKLKKFIEKSNRLTQLADIRELAKNKGKIYAASNNKLVIIDGEKYKDYVFESRINSIKIDSLDRLWIGTENGVFIYKDNHISTYLFNEHDELEFINFIQVYDTLIYFGTNNGLFEIGQGLKHQIHYGINSGLIDLETNLNSNFLEDGKYLWFGTASGIMRMDLSHRDELIKKHSPRLKLVGISINSVHFTQEKLLEFNQKKPLLILKASDKNITFDFDGIYFNNFNTIKYQYYLDGFSDEWSAYTDNPSANFTNLDAGEYTLFFKVENINTKTSNILSYQIKVLPPFYKTWWFFTIIGILIIILLVFIEKLRTNRIRRKNYQMRLEFQNRLQKLEQQSLNANMNRHFIFNSLNSIQYYINSADAKSANKYLSRFAKLIRKNLDSSYNEDGMVTLEDEIERLKLYLELESMRFIDRFDYTFYIDEDVEIDVLKVPAMFLQPFVENSIIHGVLPLKDRKGQISISIDDHLDHIRITIKDNGIGIDVSKTQKSGKIPEHQSRGMLITQNRINLLQKFSEQSISIIGPKQINENDSSVNGTIVIFKILKQYLA